MRKNDNRNLLRPAWRNFALRVQTVSRNNKNAVIVQMTVLVNRDGNPSLWTQPKVIPLEPRLDFDIMSLNEDLTPDELQALLQVLAARG